MSWLKSWQSVLILHGSGKLGSLMIGATLSGFPQQNMKDLADLYSINLHKDGVSIKVEECTGDLEPHANLQDIWIQMRRIPPKRCSWKVFDQLASSYGLLDCRLARIVSKFL